MGGFEWGTKLKANKRHGVEQAVAVLSKKVRSWADRRVARIK